MDFAAASGDLIRLKASAVPREDSGLPPGEGFYYFTGTDVECNVGAVGSLPSKYVSMDVVIPEDMIPDQVADLVQSKIDLLPDYELTYTDVDIDITSEDVLDPFVIRSDVRVRFKFGEDETATDDKIAFKPRVTYMTLVNPEVTTNGTDLVITNISSQGVLVPSGTAQSQSLF